MKAKLPQIFLARHGETDWAKLGRHTGLTDRMLTKQGEIDSVKLGESLKKHSFSQVLTSPLQRASRTCDLSGFGSIAKVDRDLVEWNYGDFEGLTSAEIELRQPGWELFRDGCPNGETVTEVTTRATRVVSKVREMDEDVLIFSSSHFLRVLVSCWLGISTISGRFFYLETASLSILGYHHDLNNPVIRLWNDRSHLSQLTEIGKTHLFKIEN